MRLAEDSRAELELFFREFLRDASVRVPRVEFYAGAWARRITRAGRIDAITLGRRVFVAPSLLSRRQGRTLIGGPLAAHEVAHVLQYQRVGALRFLVRYLKEYRAGLRRAGALGAAGRRRAYREISFEREARTAERAFNDWRARARPAPLP